MLILRVHHLLCLGLYSGHGYSKEFTAQLNTVIQALQTADKIQLTTNCDTVCSACPNRLLGSNGAHICSEDNNHVHIKDTKLLTALNIKEGKPYARQELHQQLLAACTEEVFNSSCSNCDWFKQGYCTFSKWVCPV